MSTDQLCQVCAKPDCFPLRHADEVLSDENAKRYAGAVLSDLANPQALMLARYIVQSLGRVSLLNIRNKCIRCHGAGDRYYGSTATWRGGVGGQRPTRDLCDVCWGSGDKDSPWMNLREHLDNVDQHIAERALDLLAQSVGVSIHNTHPAIEYIADILEKLGNKRGAPAAPYLPELAQGLAKTLRRAMKDFR